jgi:uncharacterized protein (DUF488 family)
MTPAPIYTVGHSTHPIDVFLAMLQGHGVGLLVDVRTVPGSRRNPQFAREALQASLDRAGIRYAHVPALGGLRRPRPDSTNTGWRNTSFRGYADHMQTPAFRDAIDVLLREACATRLACMCAEALTWRCHRSLIADALIARGCRVEDIVSPTRTRLHTLTPFAVVHGDQVTYPGLLDQA